MWEQSRVEQRGLPAQTALPSGAFLQVGRQWQWGGEEVMEEADFLEVLSSGVQYLSKNTLKYYFSCFWGI
jgi:hypothetical protein